MRNVTYNLIDQGNDIFDFKVQLFCLLRAVKDCSNHILKEAETSSDQLFSCTYNQQDSRVDETRRVCIVYKQKLKRY